MGSSTEQYAVQSRVVRSKAITNADTNTTVSVIDVPAKTLVLAVWIVILTDFDGGTPSIDIGDDTNPDGWIDTTDITEITAGTYKGTETNTGAYADTGKYYAAKDEIDAVVATGLTAGKAYVFAEMVSVEDIIDD